MTITLKFRDFQTDRRGRRYPTVAFSCLRCEDTGWVTIWHPETVRQAMIDPDAVGWWEEIAVLCKCDAADKQAQVYRVKGPTWDRRGKPIPAFGDQKWHILSRQPDAKAKAATFDPSR